jgi:lipopolysaccharide/colanic/teichoic acid biosynthesis glycosyltransferase
MPVFVLVSILIRLKLGKPIFFLQKRPGLGNKPFRMIKFRTLSNSKDRDGNLLPDNQRLTRFGAFLRATSLDEIPELWNVLKGEMSFVGPRPLRMYYLPLYNDFQKRRHEVLPGITGWAQINGRNAISWEQKFELDVWYVDHQSFWLDLKIFWLTFSKVLKRENTTSTEGGFTEPFRGTGNKMVSEKQIKTLKQNDSLL